jgi:hypothetical protein
LLADGFDLDEVLDLVGIGKSENVVGMMGGTEHATKELGTLRNCFLLLRIYGLLISGLFSLFRR